MKKKLHIGTSTLTNTIFAGGVLKDGMTVQPRMLGNIFLIAGYRK